MRKCTVLSLNFFSGTLAPGWHPACQDQHWGTKAVAGFSGRCAEEQGQFNLKRWRDMSVSFAEIMHRIQPGAQQGQSMHGKQALRGLKSRKVSLKPHNGKVGEADTGPSCGHDGLETAPFQACGARHGL